MSITECTLYKNTVQPLLYYWLLLHYTVLLLAFIYVIEERHFTKVYISYVLRDARLITEYYLEVYKFVQQAYFQEQKFEHIFTLNVYYILISIFFSNQGTVTTQGRGRSVRTRFSHSIKLRPRWTVRGEVPHTQAGAESPASKQL